MASAGSGAKEAKAEMLGVLATWSAIPENCAILAKFFRLCFLCLLLFKFFVFKFFGCGRPRCGLANLALDCSRSVKVNNGE